MSPKDMYDYFTHADNPDKTPMILTTLKVAQGLIWKNF